MCLLTFDHDVLGCECSRSTDGLTGLAPSSAQNIEEAEGSGALILGGIVTPCSIRADVQKKCRGGIEPSDGP